MSPEIMVQYRGRAVGGDKTPECRQLTGANGIYGWCSTDVMYMLGLRPDSHWYQLNVRDLFRLEAFAAIQV